MRLPIHLAAVASLVMSGGAAAAEHVPAVEKLRNGFYVSTVDLDGRIVKRYLVDTRAQLCFSSDVVIPCRNLKLRDEWQAIISWE